MKLIVISLVLLVLSVGMICTGNRDFLYYCFPDPAARVPVAKARLGAEESFKLAKSSRKSADG